MVVMKFERLLCRSRKGEDDIDPIRARASLPPQSSVALPLVAKSSPRAKSHGTGQRTDNLQSTKQSQRGEPNLHQADDLRAVRAWRNRVSPVEPRRFVSPSEAADLWAKQQQQEITIQEQHRQRSMKYSKRILEKPYTRSDSSSFASTEDANMIDRSYGDSTRSDPVDLDESFSSRAASIISRPETDSGDSQPIREKYEYSTSSEPHHHAQQYSTVMNEKILKTLDTMRRSPRASPTSDFSDCSKKSLRAFQRPSPGASPVRSGRNGDDGTGAAIGVSKKPSREHQELDAIVAALDQGPYQVSRQRSFSPGRPRFIDRPISSGGEVSDRSAASVRAIKPCYKDSPQMAFAPGERCNSPGTALERRHYGVYSNSPQVHVLATSKEQKLDTAVSDCSSSSPSERRRQRSRSRGRGFKSSTRRSASPKLNDQPNMVAVSSSMSSSTPGKNSEVLFQSAHPVSSSFDPAGIVSSSSPRQELLSDERNKYVSTNEQHRNPTSDHAPCASEVESDVKVRYLQACEVFRSALLAKDSSLDQSEKDFLVDFLLDKAQSDPSEEHVAAMESATGALLSDTLFHSSKDDDDDFEYVRPETDTPDSVERGSLEDKTMPLPNDLSMKKKAYHCLSKESILSPGSSTTLFSRHDGEYPFEILGTKGIVPTVLTPTVMEALRGFFPMSVSEENFLLRFSLERDGTSLQSLVSNIKPCKYTIFSLETTDGYVFGSFTSTPWKVQSSWYGSGESFLWRLKKPRIKNDMYNNDSDNEIEIYPYTGQDDMVQFCSKQTLAVGGGSDWTFVQGGSPHAGEPTGIGFLLDGDLLGGETNSSVTFHNPRLGDRAGRGNEFNIQALEVWTITPCSTVNEAELVLSKREFVEEHARPL